MATITLAKIVDAARALSIRAPNLRSVSNILKCGLDRQGALFAALASPVIVHDNVRGPDYYH